MEKVMQGIVHGRTIELAVDPELQDGSEVEIVLRLNHLPSLPPGWKPGSTETAAGMMADHWTQKDDEILEQIYRDRKLERRQEPAE